MTYEFEISTDLTLIQKINDVVREGIINVNEPFIGSKPVHY